MSINREDETKPLVPDTTDTTDTSDADSPLPLLDKRDRRIRLAKTGFLSLLCLSSVGVFVLFCFSEIRLGLPQLVQSLIILAGIT